MSATSQSEFGVETIVDLLAGSATDDYTQTGTVPDRIAPLWEFSHSDRINYPDPALYVWSPVETDLQKFSIDGDHMLEDETIEVLIMTLESTLTKEYQRDVIQILSSYYNDNEQNTNYYTINPTTASDLRNEHLADQTDHYLSTVQIEPRKYQPAGIQ
jgi:hypothetical protein